MRRLVERVATDYLSHGCVTHGAALAFYALFVLVPVPIFVVSGAAALVGSDVARSEVLGVLRTLTGEQMAVTLSQALETASELTDWHGARLFGLASLVFGATAFFVELQDSLNKIWDVPAGGFRLWRFLRSRFASFAMVALSGAALLILTLGSAVARTVGEKVTHVFPFLAPALGASGLLVALLITAGLFALVFRYVPEAEVTFRDVWLGSLLAAALFVGGNELLSLYLRQTRLATAYGAAGSLVLTLIWIYYSSLAFLLGAELTRALGERSRPPRRRGQSRRGDRE